LWTIANTSNLLSNGEVKTILPTYVNWLNKVSPSTEKLTWNSETRELIWRLGDVKPAGSGPAREVAFQVEIEPLNSQVGSTPAVIGDQVLTGIDTFSNTQVTSTSRPLTTWLQTDTQASDHDGRVQE
jgi:hypothetical protein